MRTWKGLVVFSVLMFGLSSWAGDYRTLPSETIIYDLEWDAGALRQMKGMRELSMRQDIEAEPLIQTLTQSPYLNVRLKALHALGRYRDPKLLSFFESIILDYEGKYTSQERVVAAKEYMNIKGADPEVVLEAGDLAVNPLETMILNRIADRESVFSLSK